MAASIIIIIATVLIVIIIPAFILLLVGVFFGRGRHGGQSCGSRRLGLLRKMCQLPPLFSTLISLYFMNRRDEESWFIVIAVASF
jgi:hypothetical protein